MARYRPGVKVTSNPIITETEQMEDLNMSFKSNKHFVPQNYP